MTYDSTKPKDKSSPYSKPARFLACCRRGDKTKKQCEIDVYGKYNFNTTQIERTKSFKEAQKQFKDSLLTPVKIAKELNKNILQDKDKGAKNVAIRMGVDAHELIPKEKGSFEVGDVKIIFGQKNKTTEK